MRRPPSIIFSTSDFEELNRNCEIRMGPAKLAKIGLPLLGEVVTGGFGGAALRKFPSVSLKAE